MTSERQANAKQNSKQGQPWTPPRGIRFFEDHSRPQPFFVQWRDGQGKRKTRSFETRAQRETTARDLASERSKPAAVVQAPAFSAERLRQFAEFERIVGADSDPVVIAVEWQRAKASTPNATTTFADAKRLYLAAREAEGIGHETLIHARMDLKRAEATLGTMPLGDIKADTVRDFIAGLKFADVTKRNHYKRLNALFNWAIRERLASVNPCVNVAPPSNVAESVEVLSVEDAEKLFRIAWDVRPEACARLALEAFAGLRFSSAGRLEKADIAFADKGITLPGPKLKTRRRQYIDGLPANLWAWIDAAPTEAWTMTERQYMAAKSEAFALAKVKNPGNVLRHSFASYHVAQNKDAAKTAIILCHTSPRMLYQHYKGRATAADGKRYFAIVPAVKK